MLTAAYSKWGSQSLSHMESAWSESKQKGSSWGKYANKHIAIQL